MSCVRAQGFLEQHQIAAETVVDANKETQGRDDALRLARAAQRVVVAKGKKLVSFDMKKDAPDDQTLLSHILGPTGNLRAPTIRKGKNLYVGFSEEAYQDFAK